MKQKNRFKIHAIYKNNIKQMKKGFLQGLISSNLWKMTQDRATWVIKPPAPASRSVSSFPPGQAMWQMLLNLL